MIRQKFSKKVDRNPQREIAVFIGIIIFILVTTIFAIRFFLENRSPFSTDKQQLGYLDFRLVPESKEDWVDIKMFVKNISDKPVQMNFPYSSEVDFLVYRMDNWVVFEVPTMIWSSAVAAKSKPKPQVMVIAPGEEKMFSARWPHKTQSGVPVRGGDFNIVAKMITSDFSVSLSSQGGSD